ncbi:hypothetical protein GYA49_05175 [Candidatus Beckwithbacteria bacterium]|nr:hypothetical protein [Candidatus Beckwithbacteria bacterium]
MFYPFAKTIYEIRKLSDFDQYINYLANDYNYAKRRFKKTFGYDLNLRKPKTFNEKIQYLKLHYRKPILTRLADKYTVRSFVKKRIGAKYLNTCLGVYSSVLEINPSTLPSQFVLKATHGSSWNIICSNKDQLDWGETIKTLKSWLKQNYFKLGREWCYKNIPPQIICEKYLGPNLPDYKFFCFHGKPYYIQVDLDRFGSHKRNFYNLRWEKLTIRLIYPNSNKDIKKPKKLTEMITVAQKLSKDFPFVRIDLYEHENSIIFGEMTFYPENGFGTFRPQKYDYQFGTLLKL